MSLSFLFIRGFTFAEVDVSCIDSHASLELQSAIQVLATFV